MSTAAERQYNEVRAKLLASVEARGFADPGEREYAEEHATKPASNSEVFRCPVGYCHPRTARAVEVAEQGQFCRRHELKLSMPLRHQFEGARKRLVGMATAAARLELINVTREAIKEARRQDEHWYPWAITVDAHAEPFECFEDAVRRYWALHESGISAGFISGKLGNDVTLDQIRSYCPHEVCTHNRVLGSSIAPGKGDESPLHWAILVARRENSKHWPTDKVVVVNQWTGEILDLDEARAIAERGQR